MSMRQTFIPYHKESIFNSIMYKSLMVFSLPSIDNNNRYFNYISSILSPSTIDAMDIKENELFIGILIELIRSSPHLKRK